MRDLGVSPVRCLAFESPGIERSAEVGPFCNSQWDHGLLAGGLTGDFGGSDVGDGVGCGVDPPACRVVGCREVDLGWHECDGRVRCQGVPSRDVDGDAGLVPGRDGLAGARVLAGAC